jgi:hypothetical protein
MAKADKGEVMTYGYDLETLVVALENVEAAAKAFFRHPLPDWLVLRLAHIRAEAYSLRVEIEKTKGSDDDKSSYVAK